jgi:hypothetical protein
MAKRFKLSGEFTPDYTVIGLSSQARGYRLAMVVNQRLDLHLRRVMDFPGRDPRQPLFYILYQHEDHDLRRIYNLLYNRNTEGLLIPALKGIDAFLVVLENLSSAETGALLSRLRHGTGIQAAYEIRLSTIKDFDLLLEDLEVHIMGMKSPGEK